MWYLPLGFLPNCSRVFHRVAWRRAPEEVVLTDCPAVLLGPCALDIPIVDVSMKVVLAEVDDCH